MIDEPSVDESTSDQQPSTDLNYRIPFAPFRSESPHRKAIMTELHNNLWIARDNDFATRVEVSDIAGFFFKTLTIEPGVRAMILEGGHSVGEVPPGQYTLQGLTDKLKFWTKKTITAILTRQGEVALDLNCSGLATSELLEVEVAVRLSVQIDDVALFQKNLLASRQALTVDDLREIVLPIVRQALWETVGRLSIKDLTGDQARTDLELCVGQALGTALVRNGLRFSHVQTLSVSHPEYDEHRRRTGQLWLQRLDLEHDHSAASLAADRLFAEIQQQEKTNELEVLAQQVSADRMEGDLAARIRRVGIRQKLRQAILAGEFDRLKSEDELAQFLLQRDTEKLLRQDEFETLAATLKEQSADRSVVRIQLLRKLEVEQQAELQGLRVDLDFAQRARTRRHEISLAELNDSEDSRRWKAELEREAATAETRRIEAIKQLDHDRKQTQVETTDRRDDELQEVLQVQRLDRVQGEVVLAQVERTQRVELIKLEMSRSRTLAEQDIQRRKAELEREINNNASSDQLERLRQVQLLNAELMQAQHDLNRAAQQQQAELEVLKEDKVAAREIGRIQSMRGLSALELLATSANAAIIADVMKHKSTQKAVVETSKAQATAMQATSTKHEDLYQKLNEAERLNADKVVAAMREAMQAQQATFQQFGGIVEGITRNLAPQPNPTVIVSGGSATSIPATGTVADQAGRRVLVCQSCRAENSEADRFCRQCGKSL